MTPTINNQQSYYNANNNNCQRDIHTRHYHPSRDPPYVPQEYPQHLNPKSAEHKSLLAYHDNFPATDPDVLYNKREGSSKTAFSKYHVQSPEILGLYQGDQRHLAASADIGSPLSRHLFGEQIRNGLDRHPESYSDDLRDGYNYQGTYPSYEHCPRTPKIPYGMMGYQRTLDNETSLGRPMFPGSPFSPSPEYAKRQQTCKQYSSSNSGHTGSSEGGDRSPNVSESEERVAPNEDVPSIPSPNSTKGTPPTPIIYPWMKMVHGQNKPLAHGE